MKNVVLMMVMVVLGAACTPRDEFSSALNVPDSDTSPVIWDTDTREEVATQDPAEKIAMATAVFFFKHHVSINKDGSIAVPLNPLRVNFPVCESEPFRNQDTLGHCSGVLIGPRQVLTAGHCMREEVYCKKTFLTFGRTEEKAKAQKLAAEEVYSCSKIIKYVENQSKDYAIIELDRDVTQATPVAIGKGFSLQPKDPVTSLSYPLGLPLKKDTGEILKNDPVDYIMRAKVDTYSGSSGSPLFNSKNELVGILIKGSDDFPEPEDELRHHFIDGTCVNSRKCKEGICNGEVYLKTDAMELK